MGTSSMDTDFIASDRMAPPPELIAGNYSHSSVYQPTTVQRPRKQIPFQTTLGNCLGGTSFFTMTVLIFLNVVTDLWVLAVFGLNDMVVWMGIAIIWLAVTSFCLAVAYAIMTRRKEMTVGTKPESGADTALCFCSNMFCQLGIVCHRFYHFAKKAEMCQPNVDVTEWSNKYKQEMARKDWVFASLFLAHGILQSGPMVVLNILAMFISQNPFGIQYVSAMVSVAAMVFSATIHERARKERLRKKGLGPIQTICIWLYYSLIIIARILAICVFGYFYRKWLSAVLVPHFILVSFFFLFVYRNVWKVRYYKILIHSFYCIFAYFPLHNEYRPEGEIMIFYAVFLLENVLMVSLPYGVGPVLPVHRDYIPGSSFYRSVTIMVLVGSAIGLVILATYYFFLHRSRDDIQESHFSCFGDLGKKAAAPPPRVPTDQALDISKIYLSDNANNENQTRQAELGDKSFLSDMDETYPPPAYRSHNRLYKKRGESTSTDLDYKSDVSDVKTPLATSDADTSRMSALDSYEDGDSDTKPPRH